MFADRTEIELRAFQDLRDALIRKDVPAAIADELARDRVNRARSTLRYRPKNPTHFDAKRARTAAEALVSTCDANVTAIIRNAVFVGDTCEARDAAPI